MFSKLLAVAGIATAALAMTTTAAFASTHGQPQTWQQSGCQQQGYGNYQDDSYQQQGDNYRSSCCNETITFDFAPSRGNRDGTWLLETGGPALHTGETVQYDGGTWTVRDWTPGGRGTLGTGDYFILVKGGYTLSGSLRENPQTAWIERACITSYNPCDDTGYLPLTTESYSTYGGYGDSSNCTPCKPPVTPPCKTLTTWTPPKDPCPPVHVTPPCPVKVTTSDPCKDGKGPRFTL